MKMKVVVLCSGMENSPSLLELFMLPEELIEVKLQYAQLPMRKSDQRGFVADLTKTQQLLMWKPRITSREGTTRLIDRLIE